MKPQNAAIERRILLGVSGGIAAYKAAELTRLFVRAGYQVQVVTTSSAERFVSVNTFQALSGRPVRNSLWDMQAEAGMSHIELARWADVIVLAPASANLMARLAAGLADDLLTTLCLATDCPVYLAPAMNRLMWENRATQANLTTLCERGFHLIGPENGAQACGETGEGRMSEPGVILDAILGAAAKPLENRIAVVTAGPTREALDPIRYLSNRSSGKQGFAVAQALAELGAKVTLIAGPVQQKTPPAVQRIDVLTAQQMLKATIDACDRADLLVGAAAVADYRPAAPAMKKIKKTDAGLRLELVRNPDILTSVRSRYPDLFIVGFAAETEQVEERAIAKLNDKRLNLIAANCADAGRAFGTDDNSLTAYWPNGRRDLGHDDKTTLARALANLIVERLTSRNS